MPMPKPACAAAPNGRADGVDEHEVHRHSANSAPAGRPIFSMSRQSARRGVQSRGVNFRYASAGQKYSVIQTTPMAMATNVAMRRARDAERRARAPAEDQHRREHDVEDDRRGLHDHAGPEVAGAAQRRAHRDQAELQRHRRDEPEQVLARQRRGRLVGAERARVRVAHGERDDEEQDADDERQHLRLVEHEGRLRLIAPARGVRDERRRADAEHLRGGQHDEHQVAADADGGDRFGAQPADPVEIDEDVERLEDHADQHVAGRFQEMAGERSRREILHRCPQRQGIAYLDPLEICAIDSGPDCAQRVPASSDPREIFRIPGNFRVERTSKFDRVQFIKVTCAESAGTSTDGLRPSRWRTHMKRVYGLVAISIFFISCTQAPAPAPAPAAPAAKPYGTLAQMMRGIPFPNSNIIFDTQSTDPAAAQKPPEAGAPRVADLCRRLRRVAGGRECSDRAAGDGQSADGSRPHVRERPTGAGRSRRLQEVDAGPGRCRCCRLQGGPVEEHGPDGRGERNRGRCLRGVPREVSRQGRQQGSLHSVAADRDPEDT